MAAVVSITTILPQAIMPASAATERSIYLYYTHTGETARIVFKRNGQYVQSGLTQLNQFLRDWRRNEPAKMDPRLFDLVWEVYQEVGATQPINVVSAYRSPATNAMLRSKSSGVAENSQHTRGNAMDFFIPGISLSKLRATAMRKQVGGVGFYPTSGSPFVHLDTGNVRAWPRMTRAQLQDVFPDGKTMHVPTDGKPLSQKGYQMAQAEWQRCHAVPCSGNGSGTAVASNGSGKTLFGMMFGGDENESEDVVVPASRAAAPVQVAAVAPAQQVSGDAPTPMMRPAALGAPPAMAAVDQPPVLPFSTEGSAPLDAAEVLTASAPVPAIKSQSLLVATAASLPADGSSETAVTAIAALSAPFPQPRLNMTQPADEPVMVTAYAPSVAQDPEAQRALQLLIARNTPVATPVPAPVMPPVAPRPMSVLPPLPGTVQTASLSGSPVGASLTGLFDHTFGAAQQQGNSQPVADALAEMIARHPVTDGQRNSDLIAPDLEHIAEIFVTPVTLDSGHFAVIFEHDEADFDPATEMGRYVTVMGAGDVPAPLSATRFMTNAPSTVATN